MHSGAENVSAVIRMVVMEGVTLVTSVAPVIPATPPNKMCGGFLANTVFATGLCKYHDIQAFLVLSDISSIP